MRGALILATDPDVKRLLRHAGSCRVVPPHDGAVPGTDPPSVGGADELVDVPGALVSQRNGCVRAAGIDANGVGLTAATAGVAGDLDSEVGQQVLGAKSAVEGD